MTPDEWLEKNYLQEIFSGQFDHLKNIIDQLDLAPKGKVVTIAGTNGKGECARSLNYLLNQSGFSTALLTSPHLVKVNERFVFGDVEIFNNELLKVFESIHSKLPQRVSYFEFLFLCFLKLVKDKSPKFVILEVGLGGRLDACNAVDCDIAVITSISRDHQDLLGNSYKKILREKAGIIRKGKPVFTTFKLDILNQEMRKIALEKGANWVLVESVAENFSLSNQKLAHTVAEWIMGDSVKYEIPLFAKRKEVELKGTQYDLFPSHNPEGIRKLFQFLNASKYNDYDYLIVSFSEREWSDTTAMLGSILQEYPANKIYYYLYQHNKSLNKSSVQKLKDKFEFNQIDQKSFDQFHNAKRVLVTGSNYFLGHFIKSHASGE